jgi:TolB protein
MKSFVERLRNRSLVRAGVSCALAMRVALSAAALVVMVAAATPAHAQVRGEIVGPGATRMPIAVPELKPLGGFDRSTEAREFTRVLRRDLEMSGLFRVVDPQAYIEDPSQMGLTPETVNFENWASIGAKALIAGSYTGSAGGLTVEARFFDVGDHSSSGGRRLSGDAAAAGRLAHRMADAVLEYVTGTAGPFDSQIAYISNREGRMREVYVMTLDGKSQRVTRHNSITMAPSWHPSNRALLFTSFHEGRPGLYTVDITTGIDSRLASKLGVNVGGAWSPDGSRVLVARETEGNTDIYELAPASQQSRRLTEHWGIDTDPTWSPDGSMFALCSSRGGSPQVYIMRPGSSEAQRVTFDGDYNCAPSWSPDGKWIAYAGRRGGNFQLFVIPASGGRAVQLTQSGSNEDPTWAPDSRYVAFSSRRGGRRKIYMVDRTGRWEYPLTDGPSDDSSPNWSGRLN